MSGFDDPIMFFAGENPEALKQAFIDAWVYHGDRWNAVDLGQNVFKDLPSGKLRGGKAGQYWAACQDVLDAVKAQRNLGKTMPDTGPDALKRRAMAIADDRDVDAKDKLNALLFIARMDGLLKKEVETNPSGAGVQSNADIIQAMSKMLPV